jgi:[ribosomal protein S18]-alanine N-acetyltransferase
VGVIIREYRPADFERLLAIDHAAFVPALAYSRSELRYYVLARRGRTLVAETAAGDQRDDGAGGAGGDGSAGAGGAGEVVGFVIARCAQRGWGTVVTLDVAPAWQRRGIGGRLMAAIEAWLAAQGVRVVSLETPADESGASQFYERHGYQLGTLLRGYYHGRVDAFAMFKRLAAPPPAATAPDGSAGPDGSGAQPGPHGSQGGGGHSSS